MFYHLTPLLYNPYVLIIVVNKNLAYASIVLKVSENDNTFERNEDCATVILKWTDFSDYGFTDDFTSCLSVV